MRSRALLAGLVLGGAVALASVADAAVIRVNEDAFVAGAGLITFSEFAGGTVNPHYDPADYGGDVDGLTVDFDGFFQGQQLGASSPPCPPGAALSGCVLNNPTGPLALDPSAPDTFITGDGANPTSPVLSGSPLFNGPIAILFGVDVAGVGLDGGFFNGIAGTAIEAFDRDGNVIGSVANVGLGIEFLGLVTDDGVARIAGLLFRLVGPEPAGFAIDNVRFGIEGQVVVPGGDAPEPATLGLVGLGLLGLAAARRLRRA